MAALVAAAAARRPELTIVLAGAMSERLERFEAAGEQRQGELLLAPAATSGDPVGLPLRELLEDLRAPADDSRRAIARAAAALADALDRRVEIVDIGFNGGLRATASPGIGGARASATASFVADACLVPTEVDDAAVDRVLAWSTFPIDRHRLRDRFRVRTPACALLTRRRSAPPGSGRSRSSPRRRRGMRILRHDRHCRERRNARLTNRDEVRTRPHGGQKIHDVAGIFVKAEPTRGKWHVARVVPVRDVDVLVRQHRLDRVAQQCGEVARHRRDDQDPRARVRHVLAKAQQGAEWRRMGDFLVDGNVELAVYLWGYRLWTRARQLRGLVGYFDRLGISTFEELQEPTSAGKCPCAF